MVATKVFGVMKRAGFLFAVLVLLVSGCTQGDGDPVATATAAPAPTPAPTATTEPEPTPAPTATTEPEPTPAPTATTEPAPTPAPTATTEPLTVLSLAAAKSGAVGSNWAAEFDGDGTPFIGFVEPDGEVVEDPNGVLSFVVTALVVSGTPDDEWVEIDVGWAGNRSTAWIRSADHRFTQTSSVFEMVRSTGELRLWESGEVIWSAESVSPQERVDEFVPLGVGGVVAVFEAEQFSGRFGPEYHPEIIGLSFVLDGLDTLGIAPVGIRGFTDGEYLTGDGQGVQIWVSSDELDALLDVMPLGTRVEIVP